MEASALVGQRRSNLSAHSKVAVDGSGEVTIMRHGIVLCSRRGGMWGDRVNQVQARGQTPGVGHRHWVRIVIRSLQVSARLLSAAQLLPGQ